MTASSPVPKDSPLWLAWSAYTATEGYANTKRWAIHPEHTEGSLWAAFEAGFAALRAESDRLRKRADEGHAAHAASFGALVDISLLTDLGGEVDDYAAVVKAVASLRAELEAAQKDTARIDWLEENAYQLSTATEGETNDAIWDVFPNDVDLDDNTVVPNGRSIRQAIDEAIHAAARVPETPEPTHG